MRKILTVLLLSPLCMLAQVNSVSPFTLFGLGDLSEGYFLKNMSMGGTSAALRDPLFINLANPASLSGLELTALDFAATYRFINQTDQNSGEKVKNTNSYFNYLGMGFKLTDWWGMALALTPYSQIGYSIFTNETSEEFGPTTFSFQGDGGVTQFVWGNGFEVYKNISVGANLRYLFGTNRKRISAEFEDNTFYNSRRNEETRVSDVIFDFGLQYELFLNKDVDGFAKNNLVFGASFGNNASVSANNSVVNYSYINNGGNEIPIDTISVINNQSASITLPTKYALGLSYGGRNPITLQNSWLFSADYSQTLWSEYKGVNGEETLNDAWRISAGGAFIPRFSYEVNNRKNYFNKMEYRLGGFYENSHISIDNQPVTVKGITAGVNLPFSPKNMAPGDNKINNISFGVVFGTKSSTANTLIKEDFINLTFGLTFNDLWFQKRKYR